MDLMEQLKEIVAKKGIQQKKLAEMVNYSPSTISLWFHGIRSLDIRTFQHVAKCLGYDVRLVKRGEKRYESGR